jgi:hypothetical protein
MKSAPVSRPRPAARSRRKASSNTGRVVAICAAFGVVIAAGIYATKDPQGLLQSATSKSASVAAGSDASSDSLASLDPSDPVAQFTKTGVGQMLFAKSNSEDCRRVLFDNRTGGFEEVKDMSCGREVLEKEPVSASAARLGAMQKTFQDKAR